MKGVWKWSLSFPRASTLNASSVEARESQVALGREGGNLSFLCPALTLVYFLNPCRPQEDRVHFQIPIAKRGPSSIIQSLPVSLRFGLAIWPCALLSQ